MLRSYTYTYSCIHLCASEYIFITTFIYNWPAFYAYIQLHLCQILSYAVSTHSLTLFTQLTLPLFSSTHSSHSLTITQLTESTHPLSLTHSTYSLPLFTQHTQPLIQHTRALFTHSTHSTHSLNSLTHFTQLAQNTHALFTYSTQSIIALFSLNTLMHSSLTRHTHSFHSTHSTHSLTQLRHTHAEY